MLGYIINLINFLKIFKLKKKWISFITYDIFLLLINKLTKIIFLNNCKVIIYYFFNKKNIRLKIIWNEKNQKIMKIQN